MGGNNFVLLFIVFVHDTPGKEKKKNVFLKLRLAIFNLKLCYVNVIQCMINLFIEKSAST